MKKAILTTAVAALLCLSANAGNNNLPFIKLGAKGGATFEKYKLKNEADISGNLTDYAAGWHAGVVTRAMMPTLPLYLQVEVLFEQITRDYKSSGATLAKLRNNSINFPILLGVDASLWNFTARGYTGIVLNLMSDTTIDGDESPEYSLLMQNPACWTIGLGMDIWKISLDIRYGMGMKMRKADIGDGRGTFTPVSASPRNWTISASIMF